MCNLHGHSQEYCDGHEVPAQVRVAFPRRGLLSCSRPSALRSASGLNLCHKHLIVSDARAARACFVTFALDTGSATIAWRSTFAGTNTSAQHAVRTYRAGGTCAGTHISTSSSRRYTETSGGTRTRYVGHKDDEKGNDRNARTHSFVEQQLRKRADFSYTYIRVCVCVCMLLTLYVRVYMT